MPSYTITPLGAQILFRGKDLKALSDNIVLPAGLAAQQACEVLAKGPQVSDQIQVSDLLILSEGITFCGYTTPAGVVHLIPEGCVVGKYTKITNPVIVD